MQGLANANPDRIIDAVRIFELANKAHFLYVSQPAPEKAKLLRMVLSNCAVDAVNIYPSYKKPFDLIFARAKNGAPGGIRTPDPLLRSSRRNQRKSRLCRRIRVRRELHAFQALFQDFDSLADTYGEAFRQCRSAMRSTVTPRPPGSQPGSLASGAHTSGRLFRKPLKPFGPGPPSCWRAGRDFVSSATLGRFRCQAQFSAKIFH